MRSVTDLFQMLEADTQLRVVLNRRYVFSDCRSLAPRNKEGVFTGIPHSAVEQILRYFHALGVVVAKRKDQSGLKLSKHVCHLQLAAIKQYKQHQSITFISLNPIIQEPMSRPIDFIETNLANFNKIIRPELPNKSDGKSDRKSAGYGSIKIEKSFVPEKKSAISEALRPEIDKLKQFYKRKLEQEKRMKALLAQGKIAREDLHQEEKRKKEPTAVVEDKVTVDESGQIRDEQGNLLFVKNRTTDLLINKKKDEENQVKSLAKKQKIKLHQKLSRSLLDRNLIVGSSKKRVRRSMLGLQFLEKGSYQPSERRKEVKNEVEDLNDVFEGERAQVEDQVRIIKRRTIVNLQFNREIPKVEWWDSALLNGQTYEEMIGVEQGSSLQQSLSKLQSVHLEELINWREISDEVTFQKVGASASDERIILPMFLTKQQRKKLKRKRKHEKLLQKNDKIKLGLVEPDKPKLRVGNMAIVMKNEFILDPSKIEAQAKRQTEERVNKHLESNSLHKLTKGQKKDKAIRKLKRDSAKECRRAVFKISKLVDPTHVFKVNMNAKQLALNGFVIKPASELVHQPTMVLVEGGMRAIKFYKNLMLKRIRWAENDPSNGCQLLWEGEIDNSTAGKWKVHEVGDEVESIRLLTEKKFQNFWEYMATA